MPPSLTNMYDASFDSNGFVELYNNQLVIEPDTAIETSITHIPGGNTTVVQSSGLIAQTLDLPIAAEGSIITTLRGLVGSRKTLVTHSGSTSARLLHVKGVQKEYGTYGGYFAVLSFIIG